MSPHIERLFSSQKAQELEAGEDDFGDASVKDLPGVFMSVTPGYHEVKPVIWGVRNNRTVEAFTEAINRNLHRVICGNFLCFGEYSLQEFF